MVQNRLLKTQQVAGYLATRGGSRKFERGVHNCSKTVRVKILLINIHLFIKHVIQIINMPLPTQLLSSRSPLTITTVQSSSTCQSHLANH